MSKRGNSSSPCFHTGKKVLLVEGNTDCHVVMALCGAHNIENNLFGLYDCGSDDLAIRRLNALIDAPEAEQPQIIGLMLDADQQGALGRWQRITQKLQGKPYSLPPTPVVNGTIIESSETGYPKLGFWFMPNNQTTGMLEDFINEMIPATHTEFIEQCLTTARAEGYATYKEVHRAKAIVHTYLAWQDEPGHPIGQSITARVLQPQTSTAYLFTGWLASLFTNSTLTA